MIILIIDAHITIISDRLINITPPTASHNSQVGTQPPHHRDRRAPISIATGARDVVYCLQLK